MKLYQLLSFKLRWGNLLYPTACCVFWKVTELNPCSGVLMDQTVPCSDQGAAFTDESTLQTSAPLAPPDLIQTRNTAASLCQTKTNVTKTWFLFTLPKKNSLNSGNTNYLQVIFIVFFSWLFRKLPSLLHPLRPALTPTPALLKRSWINQRRSWPARLLNRLRFWRDWTRAAL